MDNIMGTCDFPDMYVLSPWACGLQAGKSPWPHTYNVHACYNYYVYALYSGIISMDA